MTYAQGFWAATLLLFVGFCALLRWYKFTPDAKLVMADAAILTFACWMVGASVYLVCLLMWMVHPDWIPVVAVVFAVFAVLRVSQGDEVGR